MHTHPVHTKHTVDDEGNIYGVTKKLKLRKGRGGYLAFTVYKEGYIRYYSAHRFIWEAYNGRLIGDGLVINHIDGNKLNNEPSNLQECTHQENTKHSYRLGLQAPKVGEAHPGSKLTESKVKDIKRLLHTNKTRKEIGSLFNISRQVIDAIANEKSWAHVKEETTSD